MTMYSSEQDRMERAERHLASLASQSIARPLALAEIPALPKFSFAKHFVLDRAGKKICDAPKDFMLAFKDIVEAASAPVTLKAFVNPQANSRQADALDDRRRMFRNSGGSDTRLVTLGRIYWLLKAQTPREKGFLSIDGGLTIFGVSNPCPNTWVEFPTVNVGVYAENNRWYIDYGPAFTIMRTCGEHFTKDSRVVRSW